MPSSNESSPLSSLVSRLQLVANSASPTTVKSAGTKRTIAVESEDPNAEDVLDQPTLKASATTAGPVPSHVAVRPSGPTVNSPSERHLTSWIQSFIEQTANLHCPEIFRKWVAISVIGAAVEEKVWLMTSSAIHPNLYAMIIGHPGVGKTRAIREGRKLYKTIHEPKLAPISLTWASLVDKMVKSKRQFLNPTADNKPMEYHTMYICADELGTFISKYDKEMTDGLSALFDPDDYSQDRRTGEIRISIKSPQVNMLCGSTPQNLMDTMPDSAWGQGFSARLIMIFSDERILGDDFETGTAADYTDLTADLTAISNLVGQFTVTESFRSAVNDWRALGEPPIPNHPKLIHYITRRRTHLYKLSMISALDRGNILVLDKSDFNRAMGWLLEAEAHMPDIFKAGATNADGQAMDEIANFIMINDKGHGVSEQAITHFARNRVPLHSILRVIEILEQSGQTWCRGMNSHTGLRYYSTVSATSSNPLP